MEKKSIKWEQIFNFAYYFFLVLLIIWLICFRTEIWLHKATFFHDEAALLMNIKEKSFLDLFKTLDYLQYCPIFFLIFNKIIYNIYGLNEVALCFLPYIAGIFSIILIPFLSNKIFPNKAFSFLFLILFAYHPNTTIASQTFKQYSTDIFITLIILYLFFSLKDKIKTKKHFLITGFFFGIIGFFSFTSEFLIFPIFTYFIFKLIKIKNIKSSILITLPYLTLLSFEVLLLKSTYANGMNEWNNFPTIFNSYNDFSETISLFISYLGNQNLIFYSFIIGIIVLYIKNKLLIYILLAPIILNIITQILEIYPFPTIQNNRAIIYITPILMIIGMKAFEIITLLYKSKKANYIINIVVIVISIYLLSFIFKIHFLQNKIYINNNYYYFILTNTKEYINHLENNNVKPSDKIIVDKMGHISFNLYSNNKYKTNAIYLADDLVPLEYIQEGEYIWFYNTQYKGCTDEWMNGLKEWINKHCEIILYKRDNMGELLYVRKIK